MRELAKYPEEFVTLSKPKVKSTCELPYSDFPFV
jgi:hypothetical protein